MLKFVKRFWFAILIASGVIAFAAYLIHKQIQKSDFDRFCKIYTDYGKTAGENDQGFLNISAGMAEQINSRIRSLEVKKILRAMSFAPPIERYPLLKHGAKNLTGRDWSCPAM